MHHQPSLDQSPFLHASYAIERFLGQNRLTVTTLWDEFLLEKVFKVREGVSGVENFHDIK